MSGYAVWANSTYKAAAPYRRVFSLSNIASSQAEQKQLAKPITSIKPG
jgi:hypothetical protein